MASDSLCRIHLIPKKFVDEPLLKRYMSKSKELRLRSLKSDPDSFSSSLSRESRQPDEFWAARMLHPLLRQFVAVRLNIISSADSGADRHHDVLDAEWVGSLGVFGPKTLASDDVSPWSSFARDRLMEHSPVPNSDSAMSAYHLVGFYVAPEARRQGIGSMLLRAAITSIIQESQTMHNARAICTVGASHTNLPVRTLFKNLGFVEVAEEEWNTEDGRSLMEVLMHRDLTQ